MSPCVNVDVAVVGDAVVDVVVVVVVAVVVDAVIVDVVDVVDATSRPFVPLPVTF